MNGFDVTPPELQDLRERNPEDPWGQRIYTDGSSLVVPCFVGISKQSVFEMTQAVFFRRTEARQKRDSWEWLNIISRETGKASELPASLVRFLSVDTLQPYFAGQPTLVDAPRCVECTEWLGIPFAMSSTTNQLRLLHHHTSTKHLAVAYAYG